MPTRAWTLLDRSPDPGDDLFTAQAALDSADLGLPGCRVRLETLHGGLREGLQLLTLDNGRLRLAILPQRGMGIWKAWLGDLESVGTRPCRGR